MILVRYQRFHHKASLTKGAAAVLAREQTRFWLLVFAVVVFAALMRGVFVARSDFPLNDGGLFAAMIDDLQRADYRLPMTTSYNALDIPYAYPPLGFYSAALIGDLTGASPEQVLRFLPLALTVASIVVFAALARTVVGERAAAAAVVAYAVLPRSYLWLIMGGGLTRSLGWLMCLLALRQGYLLLSRGGRRATVLTALFSGLTALSHLGTAWFLLFSLVIMWCCLARNREALFRLCIAGAGAAVVAAPWWVAIVERHGWDVFVAAGESGTGSLVEKLIFIVSLNWTYEPLFSLVTMCALLGAWHCIRHGWFWLPIWTVLIFIFDSRAGLTSAVIPLALLAGLGVSRVAYPALRVMIETLEQKRGENEGPSAVARWLLPAIVGIAIAQMTMTSVLAGVVTERGLNADEREAMGWVKAHTPANSHFAIVSGSREWQLDLASEWFLHLANRQSVATVQGSEWLPENAFARMGDAYEQLQDCAVADSRCLERWRTEWKATYDFVYVSKSPPLGEVPRKLARDGEFRWALEFALRADPRYRLVYDGPGAAIFERLG